MPRAKTVRERLYQEALLWLGKDASPKNRVPKDVACVEAVAHIARQVMPFPDLFGTAELLEFFEGCKQWRRTQSAAPGVAIVSATGSGNGSLAHGHCGIFGEIGIIMSNNSSSGKWEKNYTIDKWVKRYRTQGGMEVHYFEPLWSSGR